MEPSGAAAGPSVRPPLILAVRVKRSSSLAPSGTISSPVGLGTSASANAAGERTKTSRDARTVRIRASRWDSEEMMQPTGRREVSPEEKLPQRKEVLVRTTQQGQGRQRGDVSETFRYQDSAATG